MSFYLQSLSTMFIKNETSENFMHTVLINFVFCTPFKSAALIKLLIFNNCSKLSTTKLQISYYSFLKILLF